MREMKDSGIEWIGATPETWKMIPLKYLASYNDEVLSENTDDEFEFDYIEIGSVQYGRGIIYTEHMKFKNAPSRARRIVRKDDIIVSTVRTYLKAVATIPACNNLLIASTGFIVIRPHKVLPRFMNYALLSESFISLVESHSTGISYPAINSVDVVKFKIPVPCGSEQERIAAFLDAECAEIDTVLEKTRASIEEYKKLKQAVITQAVTKGIRGDRPMKDSGIEWIGDIPAEWGVVPHKRIMHKVKEICEQYNGEDIISLTVNGVVKRDLTAGGKMPTSFDGYQYVEPNDLLLCLFDIDVTPRCVGVVRDYGVTSPAYSRFVMYDGYYNAYYDYLLRMIDDNKVFVHLSKNLRSSLTESDFGAIKTCAPPLAEQKCIAAFLDVRCDEIDALIAKKQQYLTEIENYKKSLIYEYVTGKKEVKTSVLAD